MRCHLQLAYRNYDNTHTNEMCGYSYIYLALTKRGSHDKWIITSVDIVLTYWPLGDFNKILDQ